jgi:hypothetical protein
MDKLTFISEIAKGLAWPVVVGVGLKMVGAELVTLLREITDLKIGNVRDVRNSILNSRTGINGQEAINYTSSAEKVVKLLMNTPSWRHGKPRSTP